MKSEWYFGPKLLGEKIKLQQRTRPDVLFLSVAVQFNHKQLQSVYLWFLQSLIVADANQSHDAFQMINLQRLLQDEVFRDDIKTYVRQADLGVTDFTVTMSDNSKELVVPENAPDELRPLLREFNSLAAKNNQTHIDIQMRHQDDEQEGSGVYLSWQDEFYGTHRYFAMSGPIRDALKDGRTLVVDEFDASLHPLLVRALLKLFHNPETNKNGAQLLFNTQDVTLLDLTLFRRDQIWLTEKNIDGVSHLYSLLEKNARSDEALQKRYLQGFYGGVPIIPEPLLMLND